MDIREWETLQLTLNHAINIFDSSHQFTAQDILDLNKIWLEKIYPWASHYRTVNISKGNFHFASANQIDKLMREFEKNELKKFTPCSFSETDQVTEAIAIVHTELVLIHPFRDGNGRIARLISQLMGLMVEQLMLSQSL